MASNGRRSDRGSKGEIVLGRYRLIDPLGSGAMGIVWLAEDLRLGRHVAMKLSTVPAHQTDVDAGEGPAAARISDESCVRVYDSVVDHARRRWLVMERLAGDDLGQVLRHRHHLSLSETVRVGRHVTRALDAVHRSGLVHRDVKPANILLCRDGRIVLVDFGLAIAVDAGRPADPGFAAGSLPYVAPEVLAGKPCSPASDLYALGVTLLVAATGTAAATEETTLDADGSLYRRPTISVAAGPLRGLLADLLSPDPLERPNLDQTYRRLSSLALEPAEIDTTSRYRCSPTRDAGERAPVMPS